MVIILSELSNCLYIFYIDKTKVCLSMYLFIYLRAFNPSIGCMFLFDNHLFDIIICTLHLWCHFQLASVLINELWKVEDDILWTSGLRVTRHTVLYCTGCTLSDYNEVYIPASSGGSAELPCSCADPKVKASSLRWSFRKTYAVRFSAIYPTDETKRYRDRVQLVNGAAPGHFNIVISRLTVEDGGTYRCRDENQSRNLRLVVLTVEGKVSVVTIISTRPEYNSWNINLTVNIMICVY